MFFSCALSDQAVFKKLFMNCCPKFISPLPPDYDALPENYIKVCECTNFIYLFAFLAIPTTAVALLCQGPH